ncbi:opsin-3, partial [Physeter macrocephalus]|uniref:Opsin-3 n=1 Tax=Physeter macrocephalus TaxID=9755 RepID=A0A2Y9TIL0_PHYMC
SGARVARGKSLRRRRSRLGGRRGAVAWPAEAYAACQLVLGSVGLLGVGSNLLVLVLYLKFLRLRSPSRLLLLNVSLGSLLPSVLRAALACAFRPRGGVAGGATNCMWDGFSNSLWEKSSSHKCICDTF